MGPLTGRRLLIAVICAASLAVCCALAWWQWERFATSGSVQNLGYVLQWPLFGLFPAFVVLRMRALAKAHRGHDADDQPADAVRGADVLAPPPQTAPPMSPPDSAPSSPASAAAVSPDESDDELAAYNRYLAELNARDQAQR